jgi:hypothetical protein
MRKRSSSYSEVWLQKRRYVFRERRQMRRIRYLCAAKDGGKNRLVFAMYPSGRD